MEIWKDIKNYVGFYQASSYGRIRSVTRRVLCKSGEHRTYAGKEIRQTIDSNGYLSVTLCKHLNEKSHHTKKTVHGIIAESFLPKDMNSECINHLDGHKTNNIPSNLEWCTYSKNTVHAYAKKLIPSGEDHFKSKLSNDEVLEIRNLLNQKVLTQKQIGLMFNTCQSNISLIKLKKNRVRG